MANNNLGLFLLTLSQVFISTFSTTLPACKDNEFHYEATECGSDGGRWQVPVAHDPKQCSATGRRLIRQRSCDSSCPSGQYLDVSTFKEECKSCAPGTYSLGGAVRYYNWSVMPPEFDTYSVKMYDEAAANADETACNSTWVADGTLLKTKGTSCITRLTYSTTIMQQEGSLTFWYYYTNTEDNIYFETYVRNEQCQISSQDDGQDADGATDGGDSYYSRGSNIPEPSSHYRWQNYTMKLKRGKNLVVWQVEHWNPTGSRFSNTVFIKDIEVKGVSFTSECTPCPAGKYASKERSAWCDSCPENHISNEGSAECTPCNKEKEYAPRGSPVCLLREPCKKTDYIETSSKCDKNNKFQTVYKWIEPTICSDSSDGAVKLPPPGEKKECPPCNPGMYLNETECLFCPPGTFSNGRDPCTKCPTATAPVLSHSFRWWRSLPSSMEYWCSSSYGNSCSTPSGWLLRGDYLDSGIGHADDAALSVKIETKGFAGENGLVSRSASAVGMVRIEFELDCDGPCVFTMFERHETGTSQIIDWHGRQARQNYTYAVTAKGSRTFLFTFKKSKHIYHSGIKQHNYAYDRVKIYSLVLTNTVDGGADRCRECPVGLHESGCVECPEGHYIEKGTRKCTPCDKDTYLSNNTCFKCGPGLSSSKASTKCYSSCHYQTKDGRHLNFLPLKGVHSVQTEKSFLSEGAAFIYEYHINLCGIDEPPASCHMNVSFGYRKVFKKYLNSSICQMRIIPGKNGGPTMATGVAGIGHQLMGVYEEKPKNISLDVFKDEKLLNESLLYFDYLSHTTTPSCPNGRSAWVILRCDSEAEGSGVIKFPPACHEGTCDGCNFLFLWHTKHACPLCTEKDYYKIESGCENRESKIHYSWKTSPKGCVGGVQLPKLEIHECHDMTVHEAVKQFQIVIGVIAFMVTAIIASLVFLWYKNRVLRYKLYHRVAVNESYQTGELPGAQSCVADDEDDDDEETVEFKKGGNAGKTIIKKLKDFANKEDDSVKLNESYEVDLRYCSALQGLHQMIKGFLKPMLHELSQKYSETSWDNHILDYHYGRGVRDETDTGKLW